jgi:hypothetical protein
MTGRVLRIEDSPIRGLVALGMAVFVIVTLVSIIFTTPEFGRFGWLIWALLGAALLIAGRLLQQWRARTPFLLASSRGLWLKDASSFGEIPWDDIASITKVPLAKAVEFRLIGRRRKYLARLSFWRIGLAVNLLLFEKISVPLHFTGLNADELVEMLRDVRSAHT